MFTNASSVRAEQYFRLPDAEKRARHVVHYLKKHGRDRVMDIIYTFLTSEPMGLDYASALYNQLPLEAAEYYVPIPDHFLDIANGKRESLLSSTGNSMQEADKLAEQKTKLDQREAELNDREAEFHHRETMLGEREAEIVWKESGTIKQAAEPFEQDQGTAGSRVIKFTWEPVIETNGRGEENDRHLEICKHLAFAQTMQDEDAETYGYGEDNDRQLEICKQLAFAQKMQDKYDRQLEWMSSDQRQFGCIPF